MSKAVRADLEMMRAAFKDRAFLTARTRARQFLDGDPKISKKTRLLVEMIAGSRATSRATKPLETKPRAISRKTKLSETKPSPMLPVGDVRMDRNSITKTSELASLDPWMAEMGDLLKLDREAQKIPLEEQTALLDEIKKTGASKTFTEIPDIANAAGVTDKDRFLTTVVALWRNNKVNLMGWNRNMIDVPDKSLSIMDPRRAKTYYYLKVLPDAGR